MPPGNPAGLPPLVELGISDFNRGRFYECHESLEDAWRAEQGRIRLLYQGVLQIGVGLHHQRNGNWRGAVNLITKGLGRLEEFEPTACGINVRDLRREGESCLRELQRLGRERVADFDASRIPVIKTIDGSIICQPDDASLGNQPA